jgi:hypothetical protein
MTAKEELAALKREVEELKAKLSPPKSTFVPMSDAEWFDKMHQIREGRMSMAMPPSAVRYFADGVTAADCADLRAQAHRPTSPSGTIPRSQQAAGGGGPPPSPTPGWSEPRPLTNPPGINWVDAQLIADDVRQRSKEPKP